MRNFQDDTLPDLLRQPREAVRSLQNRLLRETIDRCYRGHPYYRRLMLEHGLTPADVQTVDDLVKLPVTKKQTFIANSEDFRLQLDDLPAEERLLREIVYTTGTTSGQPTPIYNTTWDYLVHLVNSERCSNFLGIRPGDVLANVFPLTVFPMGGYVRASSLASSSGLAIVTTNTGRPIDGLPVHRGLDDAVRLVEMHRATIIYGIASFIRRMLIRAKELGADFGSVRACMITGEASSKAMREDMRRRMREFGQPDPIVWNRYGATEAVSLLECVEGGGWHNPSPDQIYLEVVDPETGERQPNGVPGLYVMTHLNRRGTVLLRYAIGDIVAMTDEVCPHCGRTSERIVTQPVRTKDIIKIKGMLVNIDALTEQFAGIADLDEYQIVVRKADQNDPFSLDELVLRLAAPAEHWARVADDAARITLSVAQVRPIIEEASAREIFDPDVADKARRLIDARPVME